MFPLGLRGKVASVKDDATTIVELKDVGSSMSEVDDTLMDHLVAQHASTTAQFEGRMLTLCLKKLPESYFLLIALSRGRFDPYTTAAASIASSSR